MRIYLLLTWCCTVVYAQSSNSANTSELREGLQGTENRTENRTVNREDTGSLVGWEVYRDLMASGKYEVGPGDEFLVFITGMEEPLQSVVLAEGGIFIPNVGTINVAGMSLSRARQTIQDRFSRIVKVGELTIQLMKIRKFPVSVLGLVNSPGVYEATGTQRVSQVLELAGGLKEDATSRNIYVVKTRYLNSEERTYLRNSHTTEQLFSKLTRSSLRRVDLIMYDATGDSYYDPYLSDGDIVFVSKYMGNVGSLGAFKRPGFYEFAEGDSVGHLIRLSLGLLPRSDLDRVMLYRYDKSNVERTVIPVDLRGILAGEPNADIELQLDDWLVLRELTDYHTAREVFISGQVSQPGYYVVDKSGLRLQELVELAGGFTPMASLAEARIVRKKAIDALGDAALTDLEFERIRTIPVSERTEDENQYFIMKSRERFGQMSVDWVELFEDGNLAHDIELLPGDAVHIPRMLKMVHVSGAISQPGVVPFVEGYEVSNYVERAGGVNWKASKEIRLVKGRTGEVKRVRDGVKVQPGDRIWVKERPDRNYWNIFTDIMDVVGQVSTIILLYASLTSG
ncbi:MAG: SLBB domain-containing protein [Candidatus Latescibacterota bacterium]|nr:SLBB domain-containing protein [Candidatus Latescibacterota bacterium]